jgi:pimeloyl-ACP methyl ester carboxylesterase
MMLCATVFAQSKTTASGEIGVPCPSRTGLYCLMYGSGDPILALHGLGASIFTWRHFVEEPGFKNRKLFLIDFKGAGDSPKPHDKKYSIIDQADLIYEFIQEYDLKNLTLMGNSYGGAVSLYLAIRLCKQNPNRLSKLILIDSGGYDKDLPTFLKILRTPLIGWLAVHILSPEEQAGIVLRASYFDDRKITKEQIQAYAQPIRSHGGRYALLQTARQAIPRNLKEIIAQYPSINVPTLILWGLEDKVLPLKLGKMLHEAIPGSRLELINNCGHLPQEERPEETICRVSEFLGLPFEPCPK